MEIIEALNSKIKVLVPNDGIRNVSTKITKDEYDIAIKLGEKMIELINSDHPNGVGLTAIQIGVAKALFIFLWNGHWQIAINPIITEYKGKQKRGDEGCLSFPNKHGFVKRYEKIKAEWINSYGDKQKATLKIINSIIFQHEYDHTIGIACIDKMAIS